ncbi:phosphatase [Domibacillus aminovorans]|uniref:Phosphatase n=2 Tax=Domibacillus aminovorans TaxID=29332 RepID=A0A177L6E7_9BACI|nr:hypothetical protein AWH49_14695 [Domibacillus aminovorans]
MAKLHIGLTLLVLSAILAGSTIISAAIYSQVLVQEAIGWNTSHGIYGTAFREIGKFPLAVSILLAILGIFLVITAVRNNYKNSNQNKVQDKNVL